MNNCIYLFVIYSLNYQIKIMLDIVKDYLITQEITGQQQEIPQIYREKGKRS